MYYHRELHVSCSSFSDLDSAINPSWNDAVNFHIYLLYTDRTGATEEIENDVK
jgi:hypothetical protein